MKRAASKSSFVAVWILAGLGHTNGAPLRCPEEERWFTLLDQVKRSMELIEAGQAASARPILADAIEDASRDLHAAFECPIGLGAAHRALALTHIQDPLAQTSIYWAGALEIALRFQQLAEGWLIYAYNHQASHSSAFIDSSAWPISTQRKTDEHRVVTKALSDLGGQTSPAMSDVPRDYRFPGLSLAIVTVCAYPADNPLPRMASSVHRLYTSRHGYGYVLYLDIDTGGRPPAWGKIRALQEVIEKGTYEWVLWVDCDIYFMDLNATIDAILLRYAGMDRGVHLIINEDNQMLNTAVMLMRRSDWSLELLRRAWGPDNSPFINHTWWEQAALAHELLGTNHQRFREVTYGKQSVSGLGPDNWMTVYPPQVRVAPQFEMNSYHPISSRLDGETWAPGKFVLSFNGVQSLTGPTVARTLQSTYYQLFCQLNNVEDRCEQLGDSLLEPWLGWV
eukprot:TRINITY_DN45466_c0_g1_i1.p1 TRINITY_DN45466_c0_g1~~TRINITY_DN45466_c0_g1_i1.p1  ORF type:complete len:451 (+),score=31.73 TRINITY_DN45466_c0_g1_i1:69-1421(+)